MATDESIELGSPHMDFQARPIQKKMCLREQLQSTWFTLGFIRFSEVAPFIDERSDNSEREVRTPGDFKLYESRPLSCMAYNLASTAYDGLPPRVTASGYDSGCDLCASMA